MLNQLKLCRWFDEFHQSLLQHPEVPQPFLVLSTPLIYILYRINQGIRIHKLHQKSLFYCKVLTIIRPNSVILLLKALLIDFSLLFLTFHYILRWILWIWISGIYITLQILISAFLMVSDLEFKSFYGFFNQHISKYTIK